MQRYCKQHLYVWAIEYIGIHFLYMRALRNTDRSNARLGYFDCTHRQDSLDHAVGVAWDYDPTRVDWNPQGSR